MGIPFTEVPTPTNQHERVVKDNLNAVRVRHTGEYSTANYPNFSGLLEAIGSTPATVYVNSLVTLTGATTTDDNIHLVPMQGGGFTAASAVTLTVNGTVSAGYFQWIFGSVSLVFGTPGNAPISVSPKWFGAVGFDYGDPDGDAIRAAIASLATVGGIVDFGPGFYGSDPFTVPANNIILRGCGRNITRIRYSGTTFQDFITVTDGNTENVGFENLGILGGPFLSGSARYVIAGDNFNAGCWIKNCLIRDGVGLVKLTNAYLSGFSHNTLVGTTPNRALAGITHAQWLEVYGDNCAPVMLKVANNSEIDHNYMLRIGSEESSGVKGFAACIIDGAGISVHNLGLENSSTYNSGGTDYVLSLKKTLVLNNFIGNINAYFENCAPDEDLVYTSGQTHATLSDHQIYNSAIGGTIFRNAGLGPLKVVGGKAWRVNCPQLQAPSTSGTTNQEGVYFERFSLIAGRRLTDASLNAQTNNVFDSFGSFNVLGCADGSDVTYTRNRRYIPKILDGYLVSSGSDSDGAYILITCGVFFNEEGETVQNKHYADDGATLVLHKLRPTTVSNYYRVFVGKAGQVYLVASASAYTYGYGNWIAEFSTDGAGVISAITTNPRLSYHGRYVPNTTKVRAQGTAIPTSGYWERGDIVENTTIDIDGPAYWVCYSSGSPGSWRAVGHPVQNVDGGTVTSVVANTYTASSSLDETADRDFVFGTALAARIRAIKEEDFTTSGNRTAALSFRVRKDGAETEMMNISAANNAVTISNADLIIRTKTPSSASDTGTAGMVAWDASYFYVCTAANTWRRTAHATW